MKEKLKYIQIDTSSEDFLFIKLVSNSIEDQIIIKEKRIHLKCLIPSLKNLLDKNKLLIEELDFIAINEGPGSWTGLRIGFATVKILSYVNNLKLIVYNNFDLVKFKENVSTGVFLIKSNNHNYYFQSISNNQIIKTGIISEDKIQDFSNKYFYDLINLSASHLLEEKFFNKDFKNPVEAEPLYIGEGVVYLNE
jgi:tRNA threonylcarbamoyl adenosine modification protein YeaZ